jgi:putative tricarboxylic transport membrane protein
VGLATVGAQALDRPDVPAPLAGVTPIARLTSEPLVVAVPSASKLRSLRELTSALSGAPSAVAFAGGPRGGAAHVLAGLLAEAVGVAPARVRYLAADGTGAIGVALRGTPGQAVVIGTHAELRTHLESGELRALAVSTAARWPGLAVPTLREQGVDLELGSWVGVVASAGIAPADRKALLDVVDRLARSASWKEQLRQQGWEDAYLLGEAFGAQLARERERAARALHGAAATR